MKTSQRTALALTLLTASLAAWAHMPQAPEGTGMPVHAGPMMQRMQGMQGMMPQRMQPQATQDSADMRALQAEMHSKMQAAKTPEERQALMTQQHEKMHGTGHMPGMPGMMNSR